MVLNVVPEAIVYGQIALSKLRRGPQGIPAQLRVEFFKKDPVVALVMPKSTVKIKKKMSHGSKVDAKAREKSKKLTFTSRAWDLFALFLMLNLNV
jgi:hypothetical protein